MSNKIIAKIDFILEMLDNIKTIISRHEGITNALNDRVEARPALLMCLLQIGESMSKIDKEYLINFDLFEDSKGSYSVRNFIAHDYEGVDLALVEDILRNRMENLEMKLNKILYSLEND
jgi:uncharacterized protein with HEPN domain